MVLFSFALLAVGIVCALVGARLARVLMPLFGLFIGIIVGFIGFQGVFGAGALSTTVAVFVSATVGVLLGVLAYAFFDLAVTVLVGLVTANALSFLGIAIGLRENGFVVLMLWLAGLIFGLSFALKNEVTEPFLVYLTSFMGVAMILASVLLVAGDITLTQVYEEGIVPSVLSVTSQSLVWLLAWIGGALVAGQVQLASLLPQFSVKSSK